MPSYAIQPQNQPQKGSGAVGLIIGIVFGVGGLFAIVIAIIIVAVGKSSSSSSSGTAVSDDTPTSTVAIETPTASADDTKTPTPNAHHPKPAGSSSGKVGEDTTPTTGTQPFPTTRAVEAMDQAVLTAERTCPHLGPPFGSTVVEITFETDGRVGTLSHKPIGGTPIGDCITAQFLSIKLGPFEGARRTFAKVVTVNAPNGSTSPSATTSGRTNRPDAGH